MESIIDIGGKEEGIESILSDFFPHEFFLDGIKCSSMEGFLQSLKFSDIEKQKLICLLVGKKAKFKGKKSKWWKTQILFWQGKEIKRDSIEFQKLLDRAFFELSKVEKFKKALIETGDSLIVHTIGKSDITKTVLTEFELCSRLTKIRDSFK